MKQAAQPLPRPTIAVRFRTEIEQAASEGVALDDMELRLTLGDVEQLKRDRAVAVADISFTNGTMRYLGVKVSSVKVAKGVVPTSVLHRQVTAEA